MKKSVFVVVEVQHHTGIRGLHYVEVEGTLVHPVAAVKALESERLSDGHKVVGGWLWNSHSQSK